MTTKPRGEPRETASLSARMARPLKHSPLQRLLLVLASLEAFFLALVAVAPVGGVSQTISPLARAWPVLLVPARAVFGDALVTASIPPERGWPALALFAVLLVGASCAAALAVVYAPQTLTDVDPTRWRQPWRRLGDRWPLALALAGAGMFGLTLLLLPSLPSDDIFSYILYGRITVIHHANPLTTAPSAFPNDPFLSLVFWRGTRSVYGPAWLLLSAGLTQLAEAFGGGLATYVLLFKLLGFGAHLANAVLIWAILGRVAPAQRFAGTLLYAWNPLCLLEFCASGHNDAIMLTFALLGVYCLVRGWGAGALVAFGLSISIKYVWLALLPLYFAMVVRDCLKSKARPAALLRAVAWRAGVVLGVVILTTLPYWAGLGTFGALLASPPAQQLDNSLPEALSWPLRALAQAAGLPREAAKTVIGTGIKLGGLAAFAWLWLRQLRRVRDLNAMLMSWGWLLFWYVVVASGWFWPWYVTWGIAVVALLPLGELTAATLVLAGGVLTLYAFLPLYAAPVYGLRAYLAFVPALAFLLWSSWRSRRQARMPAHQGSAPCSAVES